MSPVSSEVSRAAACSRVSPVLHLAVMFGPEIAKSQTRELQMRANETFTILTELVIDAGAAPGVEARRIPTVVWSLLHGLAVLAQHKQIPGSVSETPTGLAELGMRQLSGSMQRRVMADRMVGRQRELDALRAWVGAARGGAGRLVLCAGEPGIGKTRLAQELAGSALAGASCASGQELR